MIYKFKLVSDEVSKFSRTIEIDAQDSFLQLRNAILDSVGFSRDEMDSFFICEDDWTKLQEITLEEMDTSSDQDIYLMADTSLYDLVEDEGQKIMFTFDYFTDRSFFMELKEIIPGRNLSAPVCTIKIGKGPKQKVDLEEFDREMDAKAAAEAQKATEDMDAAFYGDSEFNEDELGEGFDDLSLN